MCLVEVLDGDRMFFHLSSMVTIEHFIIARERVVGIVGMGKMPPSQIKKKVETKRK